MLSLRESTFNARVGSHVRMLSTCGTCMSACGEDKHTIPPGRMQYRRAKRKLESGAISCLGSKNISSSVLHKQMTSAEKKDPCECQ